MGSWLMTLFKEKIIENNFYFLGQHIIKQILKSYTLSQKKNKPSKSQIFKAI
jgi:hypothetical protein